MVFIFCYYNWLASETDFLFASNGCFYFINLNYIEMNCRKVTTPDGAAKLMENIDAKIQSRHSSSLIQGSPVYGPLDRIKGDKTRYSSKLSG